MLFLIVGLAYLIGSLPTGYGVVKALSGQDVRQLGSGRTGGTSALRAAGVPAGLLTALLDVLKGAAGVWLAAAVLPPSTRPDGMALAGLAAMLGHSYSVFLHFKGSAGGAPAIGAAFALWPLSAVIAVVVGIAVLLTLKVGRLAELAMAGTILVLLVALRYFGQVPQPYLWFGFGAVALLAWQARGVLARRFSALRSR